jgi:DNA-binding NarL/FixJ family response regulator
MQEQAVPTSLTTSVTTVVLADDHAIVREGIASLCTANGMRVLGQVSDGGAAIEMITALQPDFAILDLHMPMVTGVEAIRRLRSQGCTVKLLILSISREEGTVMEALRAISFVRDGGVYVSPMLRGAGLFAKGEKNRPEDPLAALSPREMEVFSYLVNGLRAKDIADLLEISPKTVDTYRASLMRKLKVHDLVGLVKFAIERNLTTTSPQR